MKGKRWRIRKGAERERRKDVQKEEIYVQKYEMAFKF